ncbi:hypothetical protein [Streptomyces sp. NPDC004721]
MTYFNLRKLPPAPEPEPVEEQLAEAVDEPEADDADDGQPTGWAGALRAGLLGPGTWLAARFGTGTAWSVHAVALWASVFYGGWVTVAVMLVWLAAVGAFIPRDRLEELAAAIERWDTRRRRPPASAPDEAPLSGGREPIVSLLRTLIGDAHGVHVRTVLAHLQEHGQWGDRTVADLRVHLEALGIPVQPKVKVGGVPTRGVLRADLDALSPPEETAPSPGPPPVV